MSTWPRIILYILVALATVRRVSRVFSFSLGTSAEALLVALVLQCAACKASLCLLQKVRQVLLVRVPYGGSILHKESSHALIAACLDCNWAFGVLLHVGAGLLGFCSCGLNACTPF